MSAAEKKLTKQTVRNLLTAERLGTAGYSKLIDECSQKELVTELNGLADGLRLVSERIQYMGQNTQKARWLKLKYMSEVLHFCANIIGETAYQLHPKERTP